MTLLIALLALINLTNSMQLNAFTATGLNRTCVNNETCFTSVPNSYCAESESSEGKCTCLPKHIPVISLKDNCDSRSLTTRANENEIEACLPLIEWFDERCSVNEQCTQGKFGPLSHCLDGYCRCFPNSTFHDFYFLAKNNNQFGDIENGPYCTLLAEKLGDPCDNSSFYDQTCRNVPFSFCRSGICSCQTGTVATVTEPKQCIQLTIKVGEACDTNECCSALPNTKCEDKNEQLLNTCQCLNQSYVPDDINKGCVKKLLIDEVCTIKEQCQIVNSTCRRRQSAELRTCTCVSGSVKSSNSDACLEIVHDLITKCAENIQCETGLGTHSECRGGSCQCKNNGIYHNGQCYPLRSLGEPCERNAQCSVGTFPLICAIDSTKEAQGIFRCQCRPESHREYNGRCYPISGFGKLCETDEQCWASSSAGAESLFICDSEKNNTCSCPIDYIPNSDELKCILEVVALGEECQETRQCSTLAGGRNQFCNHSNKCQCKAGYRNASGNKCKSTGSHLVTKLGKGQVAFMLFIVMFANICKIM